MSSPHSNPVSLRSLSILRPARLPLLAFIMIAAAGCKTPGEGAEGPAHSTGGEAQDEPEAQSSFWDLDVFHDRLTRRAKETGALIDEYISNERSTAEDNETWIQAEFRAFMEEREGVDPKFRIRASLVLPNSENRAHLILSGDDRLDEERLDNLTSNAPDSGDPHPSNEGTTLGIKYFLRATESNNISVSGGLKFNDFEPNPYGSVRWRHEKDFSWGTVRATERYRHFLDEGGESLSGLDYERDLAEDLFLRVSGSGNWWEEREGYYYGVVGAVHQDVGSRRLLSYELGTTYVTEPNNVMTSIYVRVRGRQLFTRSWVLLELAPQIAWRRSVDYEPALGILLTLKFTFREDEADETALRR